MGQALSQRRLGNTDLMVTEIGLGTGYIGAWRNTPHQAAIRVVQHALELGINFIDTSPYYSNAQEILGEALEGAPQPYSLSTKCGRWDYRTGPFRSLDALKRQLETTLKHLRRDSVDNLNIHECDWYAYWEDVDSPRASPLISLDGRYDYESAPVIEFMRWAKEQGLTRHIGLSGNNAHLVGKVLREVPLPIDVVLIAVQYDLIWRNAAEFVLPVAKEKGVGVVLGGTFHSGRLATPHQEWLEDPPAWMSADLTQRFRRLYSIQQESGLSLAELDTRYLLAKEGIACIVPGTSRPERLDENVGHALAGPLPSDLFAELDALGTVVMNPSR